jgi:hypothetical protein
LSTSYCLIEVPFKDNFEISIDNYDQDDLDGADYIDYIDYYRYMINLVFVALPWAVVSIACVGWNLYFNANWNEMWAGGNVWLMANTFYILFQGFASVMLAFELPIWLRTFRTTRFWSFVFATVYNLVFFTLALEWWDMLYIVNDKSSYDFVDIFINTCLGYNWEHVVNETLEEGCCVELACVSLRGCRDLGLQHAIGPQCSFCRHFVRLI